MLKYLPVEPPSKPFGLIVTVTTRCNLNCAHCCVLKGTLKGLSADVDVNFIHKVLEEAKEYGGEILSITGGEPLLHPQIEDIVKIAGELGYSVEITTNGSLPDRLGQLLSKFDNIHMVYVSVDGCGKIHDAVRKKGSFEKVVETLDVLKNVDVLSEVVTVVHKLFIDNSSGELKQVYGLLTEKNVDVWWVNPYILIENNMGKYAPTTEELLKFHEKLVDFLSKLDERRFFVGGEWLAYILDRIPGMCTKMSKKGLMK